MAEADVKVKKTPLTPEQKSRRKAARLIGWTIWADAYKATNPKATKDERKAAWTDAQGAQNRTGRRVLKTLEKNGFSLAAAEAKAKA